MRTITSLFLCLCLCLVAGAALADTPAKEQWILAVAKVRGLGGEDFVSSLRIVNPGTASATVQLTYLPQSSIDGTFSAPGDNSGRQPVSVTVAAGQTLALEDVVGTTFGSAAPHGINAGGIKVVSSVPVSVVSRTFTANARNATGGAGTFGFSIPAQVLDDAIAVGDTGYLLYTSASPSTSTGFRSNFIMQNTASLQSIVHVKLVKGDGATIGERDYTLAPLGAAQQGNIAASFGYTQEDTNLTLVVTPQSGGAVVIGTSIIDNAIGSINYAPPSKVFLPNNGSFGLILNDGGFDLTGRLDIENALPNFLSATLVMACPQGSSTYLAFIMQANSFGSGTNTTFSRNANGYSFAGGSTEATWFGIITNEVNGTVSGTITYSRSAGSGAPCSGLTQTFPFTGARVTTPVAP